MRLQRPKNSKDQNLKKKKVLESVRALCRNRYVKIHDFPPSLIRKCVKYFGSVRHAKWEAGIIHDGHWNYKDFMEYVHRHGKRYRKDSDWPPHLRYWAKYYCGSIRCAKCEARITLDECLCQKHRTKRALTKEDITRWIQENPLKKVHSWPAHIIIHSEQYFGSTRNARLKAGTLQDERKNPRTIYQSS
jgi:hypothetical protein